MATCKEIVKKTPSGRSCCAAACAESVNDVRPPRRDARRLQSAVDSATAFVPSASGFTDVLVDLEHVVGADIALRLGARVTSRAADPHPLSIVRSVLAQLHEQISSDLNRP